MSVDAFNNAVVDIDSVAGVLRILARLDFAAPFSGEAAFVVPNGFSHIVYAAVEKTVALAPMFDQCLPRAAHQASFWVAAHAATTAKRMTPANFFFITLFV